MTGNDDNNEIMNIVQAGGQWTQTYGLTFWMDDSIC